MCRFRDVPCLDGELVAAIRALAQADAGLGKVIALSADKAAMRTYWAARSQAAPQMDKGADPVMNGGFAEDQQLLQFT